MQTQIKNYIDSLTWKWKETREGNLIHHHGHLVDHPTPVIHYSHYEEGTVAHYMDDQIRYYVYYYDDNKDDEYFKNLYLAETSITRPLIQEYIKKIKGGN